MVVNRFVVAGLVLVFLFGSMGCSEQEGGSKATSQEGGAAVAAMQAGIIDPCRLISRADAERIMGTTLADGPATEQKAVGLKICLYEAPDLGQGLFQVSLTQAAFMSEQVLAFGQSPTSIFNTTKEIFPQRTPVAGVGEEAFIAPPGLHILSRDYYLVIALGNTDRAENRARLEEAGKIAVSNLNALLE
jgi:hypothetical protein